MWLQMKVTKTISAVLVVYCAAWAAPNAAFNAAGLMEVGASVRARLGPYIGIGAGVAASANVAVYGTKHRQFRRFARRLIGLPDSASVAPISTKNHVSVVKVTSKFRP